MSNIQSNNPELREKIMSDVEIRSLTIDIDHLREHKQTNDIKERIGLLEDLRMSAEMQIINFWKYKPQQNAVRGDKIMTDYRLQIATV